MSSTLNYNQLREEFKRIALIEKAQKRLGNNSSTEASDIESSSTKGEREKIIASTKQAFWEYLNSCPASR